MAEEEKDNGATEAEGATPTDTVQADTTPADTTPADATGENTEDDIDYDAVSIDEAETGDDEPSATDGSDDEAGADDEDEVEYSTGQPPGDVERNSGLGAAAGQPELADALGALPASDGSDRPEIPGARAYELIFIARSSAADTVDEVSQRVREIVESGEGAVDHVRKSELRRLAYAIKKETEGYYVVINGRFRPTLIPELERMLELEERVLRFMLIREDD